MGFFSFKKEKNKVNQNDNAVPILTEKVEKINLRKETVRVCLQKKNIADMKARVALVLDESGSMHSQYMRGKVQDIVERILPIALNLDDNGELDVWSFSNGFRRAASVTVDNMGDYVNREILHKNPEFSGTQYAPVMNDVAKEYLQDEPVDYPSYVIFITDGDTFDSKESENIIKKLSKHNIFWQFVGIGNADFSFLEELDTMDGRFIDNANFFSLNDIERISDADLYNRLFEEFPSWIGLAKQHHLIK